MTKSLADPHIQALEFLQSAVRIPSVTGDEGEYSQYVVRTLLQLGAVVDTHEVSSGRPVVVADFEGQQDDHRLMFVSHSDTVAAGHWATRWKGTALQDPYAAHIIDGYVSGRGTVDCKGGTATLIGAIAGLEQAGTKPVHPITVLLVPGEEAEPCGGGIGSSDGMKEAVGLIRAGCIPRPTGAIYTEPTNLRTCRQAKGFLIAEITVTTPAGSEGSSWTTSVGPDALATGVAIYQELHALRATLTTPADEAPPSLQIVSLHGGDVIATPEWCTLRLIRSTNIAENPTDVARQITDAVNRVPTSCRVDVSYPSPRDHVFGGGAMDTRDSEWLRAFASATGASYDHAPYYSDGQILSQAGIETVYWGVGDYGLAHSSSERVSIAQIADGVSGLYTFLSQGIQPKR